MSVETVLDVEELVEEAFAEEVPCEDYDVITERRWLVLRRDAEVDCDEPAIAYVRYQCLCGACDGDAVSVLAMCEDHLDEIRHDEHHGRVHILAVTPIGGDT